MRSVTSTTSSGRTHAGSGSTSTGRLAQVALVYDEPDPPVLLALAEHPVETMAELLVAAVDRLPPTLYAHVTPSLLADIEPALVAATEPVAHKKLGLVHPEALDGYDTEDVDTLRASDLGEVERFYARVYPATRFQARELLETGRYVGIRRAGELACVAGVHVWSPVWRVAALGNVATAPEARVPASPRQPARASAGSSISDRIDIDLAQRPCRQRRSDPRLREARLCSCR